MIRTAGLLGKTEADRINSSINEAAEPHFRLETAMLCSIKIMRDGRKGGGEEARWKVK